MTTVTLLSWCLQSSARPNYSLRLRPRRCFRNWESGNNWRNFRGIQKSMSSSLRTILRKWGPKRFEQSGSPTNTVYHRCCSNKSNPQRLERNRYAIYLPRILWRNNSNNFNQIVSVAWKLDRRSINHLASFYNKWIHMPCHKFQQPGFRLSFFIFLRNYWG